MVLAPWAGKVWSNIYIFLLVLSVFLGFLWKSGCCTYVLYFSIYFLTALVLLNGLFGLCLWLMIHLLSTSVGHLFVVMIKLYRRYSYSAVIDMYNLYNHNQHRITHLDSVWICIFFLQILRLHRIIQYSLSDAYFLEFSEPGRHSIPKSYEAKTGQKLWSFKFIEQRGPGQWWKESRVHQLRFCSLSHSSQGFIHPRWLTELLLGQMHISQEDVWKVS